MAGHAADSAAAANGHPTGQGQQQHHSRDGLHPPCRAVGPTIQAVLEYLVRGSGSECRKPGIETRIFC